MENLLTILNCFKKLWFNMAVKMYALSNANRPIKRKLKKVCIDLCNNMVKMVQKFMKDPGIAAVESATPSIQK